MRYLLSIAFVIMLASCSNSDTSNGQVRVLGSSSGNGSVPLNPAHGQPGHRCDIEVGKPLNSAPTNSGVQLNSASPLQNVMRPNSQVVIPPPQPRPSTTVQQPQATVTAPVATAPKETIVATKPGMNPPHGQPGHRCDIEVGKPLNSAPAKTAAAQTSTAAKPKLNPPHGEPGHRCDIEVGKPLE